MPKVLLIDDDVELLDMLKDYLQQEGFDVTAVHDGNAGMSHALSGQYMIAVLDVMMPGLDGVETLKKIRAQSSMPVLMLTGKGDNMDRIVGLELGADDYVTKPCTSRKLTARIRGILRRTQMSSDDSVAVPLLAGSLTMWPSQRRAMWHDEPLELTSTEFDLLKVLAQNAGRPVSKSELSEQALGRPLVAFDRSIDVHLSSIRHKLGKHGNVPPCILTVYRQGYQFIKE
ncbi:MAG TPA: response regulator transcription factor [Rhodocyclaceae bacterium]|nr:response regulator transcription factor [Rhodocyclaceae bacterium]